MTLAALETSGVDMLVPCMSRRSLAFCPCALLLLIILPGATTSGFVLLSLVGPLLEKSASQPLLSASGLFLMNSWFMGLFLPRQVSAGWSSQEAHELLLAPTVRPFFAVPGLPTARHDNRNHSNNRWPVATATQPRQLSCRETLLE